MTASHIDSSRYAVQIREAMRKNNSGKQGEASTKGLLPFQAFCKRAFDLALSLAGLALSLWVILPAAVIAGIDTRANGFFTQERVGRGGRIFRIIKIRTMRRSTSAGTSVTTENDERITALGRFWRRTKIDELPQLFNIVKGDMSFVGPRPDVPGFADRLSGEDRIVLSVRPGITGPATLKYRDEEVLLARVDDPEAYNSTVVFPDKVRINREYVENWTCAGDMGYILKTALLAARPGKGG